MRALEKGERISICPTTGLPLASPTSRQDAPDDN
jgi:hypothetical protein